MDKLVIHQLLPIRNALEQLDACHTKTLFLTDDDGILRGSLTDGDIRRWILKTGDVKGTVLEASNQTPFVLHHPVNKAKALAIMQKKHLQAAPVISREGRIETIILKEELLIAAGAPLQELTDVPVVIMAGGKGSRLDPFTRILPKPLIPIGNQPVIERIMQEFAMFGATRFFISVNHQARLIKAYFEEQQYPYNIGFLEEDVPLGTAGALKMLEGSVTGDLFVSNCDIIIKSDYNQILRFHQQGAFELTLIAAVHNQAIPYGVCEADDNGHLIKITEKPQYSMLVNTGMYVLKSDIFSLIPDKRMFHITQLIEILQAQDRPIGVFPVPDTSYHDIGQWEAYRNALPDLTSGGH